MFDVYPGAVFVVGRQRLYELRCRHVPASFRLRFMLKLPGRSVLPNHGPRCSDFNLYGWEILVVGGLKLHELRCRHLQSRLGGNQL